MLSLPEFMSAYGLPHSSLGTCVFREDQGDILPAETEAVGEGAVDLGIPCCVWDIIQIAIRVWRLVINRGRQNVVSHR